MKKISDLMVYIDPKTGVNYIVISDYNCHGICITPRLNADGTLYISNKEDIKNG